MPGKDTAAATAAPVAAAPKKKPRREGFGWLSCIFISKEAGAEWGSGYVLDCIIYVSRDPAARLKQSPLR